MTSTTIHVGDALTVLRTLPSESVHCCVTSPPYWGLRDYGVEGQLGLEESPAEFLRVMSEVFDEVRRVLRPDGTLWLNMGDSYASGVSSNGGYSDKSTLQGYSNPSTKGRQANDAGKRVSLDHGLKPKDLCGIPWRLAFALQDAGWWLRQDIIWHKPNPMPESVKDRCTKAHEYVFLLAKSGTYYFDQEAIAEPVSGTAHARKSKDGSTNGVTPKSAEPGSGIKANASFHAATGDLVDFRTKRSVWSITTQPYSEAHFATMPVELARLCVVAGCPPGGVVLDPFGGAGTTALAAAREQRDSILIELNPDYAMMARRRVRHEAPMFRSVDIVREGEVA